MTALARDARRDIPTLETYSGLHLDYTNPQEDQIALVDIARGLSQVCRYAGQTTQFYSVAEHSVLVSRMVPEEYALAGLHHDSHEAYVGDWPSPLKYVMGRSKYKTIRDAIDKVIVAKFGITQDLHDPIIKQADIDSMRAEAATLKWSHGVGDHWGWYDSVPPLAGIGLMPAEAERLFLKRHEELT